jgi:hypothetical protein
LNADSAILPPILGLLERMLIEDGPDIADTAERALERLAFSENPTVMHRARSILSGNQHIRMRRAVAAIRELGGRVLFVPVDEFARGNMMWGWGNNPSSRIPGLPLVTIHIWILRGWEGGEEGLWHITRLEDAWSARLWKIEVTNVRHSGISMETVQSLAARLPHLSVAERGASLGIMTSSPSGECIIMSVLPDGAAAKAGLQEGDVITAMVPDGEATTSGQQTGDNVQQPKAIPIVDFADLVNELLNYLPEDKVVLKVRRGDQLLDVPVTLGGWHDVKVTGRRGTPLPNFQPPLLPDLDKGNGR